MTLVLSPAKILLLATQLADEADVDGLAFLASQHSSVLGRELLLRIVLTYLPETVKSSRYVSLISAIESGDFPGQEPVEIDLSRVDGLSEEAASRKARKLGLLHLTWPEAPAELSEDPTTLFLLRRAYRVDEAGGSLCQLPDLLTPFLDHSPTLRTWFISVLLPLLRRNCEYYPDRDLPHTLLEFERLGDGPAVRLLLSETGLREEDYAIVARDLRGLIGPWLYNESRWEVVTPADGGSNGDAAGEELVCPGWEATLEWLVSQASKSWRVAVSAITLWDGPADVDMGEYGAAWWNEDKLRYLEQGFARAALASAYLIPEPSVGALDGAYAIASKISSLLDEDPSPPLETAASILAPRLDLISSDILAINSATYLRNNLLDTSNILTSPSRPSVQLLDCLILSAFILTKGGSPCTIRRAGELLLLQDEREQKAEALKLIHSISSSPTKNDDKYWIKARNEVLWLRDLGAEEDSPTETDLGKGIFGQLKREFLETEMLKCFLANSRYNLARSLYEDWPERPLPEKTIQDTVIAAAMNAYDNASNPNRTRGGVKKCDEILHSFPKTVGKPLEAAHRIEALIRATHALSDYRLVLKQGEPFSPVVLRVHSDPISIVGKILEQNPGSYTSLHSLLDLGYNVVKAGLTGKDKTGHRAARPEAESEQLLIAEKRITAMCIDAALNEDDFETAYSYVVNHLSETTSPGRRSPSPGITSTAGPLARRTSKPLDDYSWRAALQAGKYRRTARTVRPTHLGTASGNADVRHLEQRIECLAVALRIAQPAGTLQEILKTFRRCEEELDAAVAAEAEQDAAWDAAGDRAAVATSMPGAFSLPAAAKGSLGSAGRPPASADDAPMSLFDLARASGRVAQRNFTSLSSLQRSGQAREPAGAAEGGGDDVDGDGRPRVRKRDQLREAAVGTLASGVGWLIGAQPVDQGQEKGVTADENGRHRL